MKKLILFVLSLLGLVALVAVGAVVYLGLSKNRTSAPISAPTNAENPTVDRNQPGFLGGRPKPDDLSDPRKQPNPLKTLPKTIVDNEGVKIKLKLAVPPSLAGEVKEPAMLFAKLFPMGSHPALKDTMMISFYKGDAPGEYWSYVDGYRMNYFSVSERVPGATGEYQFSVQHCTSRDLPCQDGDGARYRGLSYVNLKAQPAKNGGTIDLGTVMLNRVTRDPVECGPGKKIDLTVTPTKKAAGVKGRFLALAVNSNFVGLPKDRQVDEVIKTFVLSEQVVELNGQPFKLNLPLNIQAPQEGYVGPWVAIIQCPSADQAAACRDKALRYSNLVSSDPANGFYRITPEKFGVIHCRGASRGWLHVYPPNPYAPLQQPKLLKETDPSAPEEIIEGAAF